MSPNFLPDAFVVAVRVPWQRFAVGDVVLVNHAKYGKMIKRIQSILDKKITLQGDNPQSVTTQQMGMIDTSQIIGKVVWQIKPPTGS